MNKAIKIQNVEILINSDAGKLGGLGAHCQRLATAMEQGGGPAAYKYPWTKNCQISYTVILQDKKYQSQFTYKSTIWQPSFT